MMIIVDSRSVKNAVTAKHKGYDAEKKLHIGVDTCGLPHAMFVSTADFTDRHGALCMICSNLSQLSTILKIMADSGYTGEKFANGVKLFIQAEVEIVKRNELHTFAVLPKRWIALLTLCSSRARDIS